MAAEVEPTKGQARITCPSMPVSRRVSTVVQPYPNVFHAPTSITKVRALLLGVNIPWSLTDVGIIDPVRTNICVLTNNTDLYIPYLFLNFPGIIDDWSIILSLFVAQPLHLSRWSSSRNGKDDFSHAFFMARPLQGHGSILYRSAWSGQSCREYQSIGSIYAGKNGKIHFLVFRSFVHVITVIYYWLC